MQEITSTRRQSRKVFWADYECEGCMIRVVIGYEDPNFYLNLVATIKCSDCGESTSSLGQKTINNLRIPEGDVV